MANTDNLTHIIRNSDTPFLRATQWKNISMVWSNDTFSLIFVKELDTFCGILFRNCA